MTKHVFVYTVSDDGAQGARIEVERKPAVCPGLSGWKTSDGGATWWPRIKGQIAAYLCDDIAGTRNQLVALRTDAQGTPIGRAQHRIRDKAEKVFVTDQNPPAEGVIAEVTDWGKVTGDPSDGKCYLVVCEKWQPQGRYIDEGFISAR